MSLNDTKLPFLRIRDLPKKFRVAVADNTITKTRFTRESEEGQKVLKVILENEEGQLPLVGTNPTHFLAMSNTAQNSIKAFGYDHLDRVKNMIITFEKVTVGGFAQPTIEAKKIESW